MKHPKAQCLLVLLVPLILLSSCSQDGKTGKDRIQQADPARATSAPQGKLIQATLQGDIATVRTLLNAGADVNDALTENGEKITALFVAVIQFQEEIARLLIQRGADTQITYMGYTPRDLAFYLDQDDLARQMGRN